ncbi:MAG: hypothetical protein SFW67_23585 [Myxococcaceae bacterium]|nr:hypothetical protein [Myxococcaceae bacterium]
MPVVSAATNSTSADAARPPVRALDLAILVALELAFAAGVILYADRTPADPDRHFHFAVARAWATTGLAKTLPAVEGIGWHQEYVDKEFLFHVVTWLGWEAGERTGVVVASGLLGALVVALLYALSRRALPPLPAGLVVAAAVSCPMFLYRLALVRPHLLAIATTLLLLWAVLRRSWPWTLVAGALFALAYHALYVPLAVLGLAAVLLGRPAWRAVTAGIAGLALGTVANPFFPATLETTWMTLSIAASKPEGNTFGGELFPITFEELRTLYVVPAVMALASVALLARGRHVAGLRERAVPVALAVLFWALTLRTARASEYAIPFTAVAFATVAAREQVRWVVVALVAGLAVNAPLLWRSSRETQLDRYTKRIVDAVQALPPEAAGKKVLNCSFTEGEVVLDLRPDVRVVDVLDPTYLERFDRERHLARLRLIDGTAVDVRSLVVDTFGADYVICGYLPARTRLDDSPDFVRLRPPPGPPLPLGSGPYVYAVRPR